MTHSIRVFSDETDMPDTGDGTGRHAPDFKNELGDRGLLLRRERRGKEDGRFYVAVIKPSDGTDETMQVCTLAVVPHGSNKPESIDDVMQQAATATAAVAAGTDPIAPISLWNRAASSISIFVSQKVALPGVKAGSGRLPWLIAFHDHTLQPRFIPAAFRSGRAISSSLIPFPPGQSSSVPTAHEPRQ